MTGCSKGARGLFVPSRVIGILTDTAISPSLRKRQLPSRYSIRAGRNLPDKEFRYLRTVIVTAAVYRGFGSQLRLAADAHLNLPAPGRSQSVYVGLDNALARSCVFAKQSLGTILCGRSPSAVRHLLPAPIPKLRGHFAEFLFRKSLEPLRLLARPPVSDCGTVNAVLVCEAFLGSVRRPPLAGPALRPLRHRFSTNPDLPTGQRLPALQRIFHHPPVTLLLRPSSDS